MLTTLLGGKKEVDLRSVATKPLIEVISDNESSMSDKVQTCPCTCTYT